MLTSTDKYYVAEIETGEDGQEYVTQLTEPMDASEAASIARHVNTNVRAASWLRHAAVSETFKPDAVDIKSREELGL